MDVKVEVEENVALHLEDLSSRVRVISEVHEVFDSGRVDLLILGRYQESSNANELNLTFLNLEDGKVTIDQIDCQEEGLWKQFEFGVHADYPID